MILHNFIPLLNIVFYTEPMLIAVFITEMVILLKYVTYVMIIILTTDQRLATEVWTFKKK